MPAADPRVVAALRVKRGEMLFLALMLSEMKADEERLGFMDRRRSFRDRLGIEALLAPCVRHVRRLERLAGLTVLVRPAPEK